MNVYVLEVFWGDEWETIAVYKTEESAFNEGEKIRAKSADYVEYVVNCFEVKE